MFPCVPGILESLPDRCALFYLCTPASLLLHENPGLDPLSIQSPGLRHSIKCRVSFTHFISKRSPIFFNSLFNFLEDLRIFFTIVIRNA